MLNIWGVMLFIRMTWIVGQAGIGRFDFGRPCELALQFTSKLLFSIELQSFVMHMLNVAVRRCELTGTAPENTYEAGRTRLVFSAVFKEP